MSMGSNNNPGWDWSILFGTTQKSFFSGRVLSGGHSKRNLIISLF
jgi:hypothetical protein